MWATIVSLFGSELLTPVLGDFMPELPFDIKTLRVLRIARLVRIVRLLKGFKRLKRVQAITQLVDSLQECVKHMINVFALASMVVFVFALIGMNLFGDIPLYQVCVCVCMCVCVCAPPHNHAHTNKHPHTYIHARARAYTP